MAVSGLAFLSDASEARRAGSIEAHGGSARLKRCRGGCPSRK